MAIIKRQPGRAAGFSLMEVVTALSVISFALVALLGVFPIGLDNSRASVNETRAAQLTRMIFSTLRSEPFQAARCFGTAALDLSALDAADDDPPEVLYVSYGTTGEPKIVRETTAPPDAIYRIELRFHPQTFTAAKQPRVTGSKVDLRMTGLNGQQAPIFATSTFVGNFQRVPFTK